MGRHTWVAWRDGALDLASAQYAESAKVPFEDFLRTNGSDTRVNHFFAGHTPLQGEFLIGHHVEGSQLVLVVTNLRAWLFDRDDKRSG